MGGCEQYRIRIPFNEIRDKVPGTAMDWASVGAVQRWAATGSKARAMPSDYDIWLLPRHRPLPYGVAGTLAFESVPDSLKKATDQMGVSLQGEAHLLDLVRIARKKIGIILEYDDDHWGSRDLGYQEYVDLARQLLAEADAITVTTPYMHDLVKSYASKVPVYILPNVVKFSEWQGHDRWKRWPNDIVVIGLTGSPTHYKDWIVLTDVIPKVLRENGNAALLLCGYVPDFFEDLSARFPGQLYMDTYFREYAEYPELIRQSDIVLCPVDPTDRFNWAKSGIKAIEGMAAGRTLSNGVMGGAVPIVSPLEYYTEVIGYGRRGMAVEHTAQSWYEAITRLIRDKDLREQLQYRGWRYAREHLAIETHWARWWQVYQDVHRRKHK